MSDEAGTFSVPSITDLKLTDLPNGAHAAVEVTTGANQWYWYAIGYKESADRLGAAVGDPFTRNHLGPSILFLYRHYVELHLKSLLLDAGELLDEPQDVPPKHYIRTLWQRVRALLLRIDPNSDGPWFARADEIIRALDDLDPSSYAFRYPVARDGRASLPGTMYFDPSVLATVLDELHLLLSGASTQIDVYMGYKHEAY